MSIFDRALSDREKKTDAYFKRKKRKPRRPYKEAQPDFLRTEQTTTLTVHRNMVDGTIVNQSITQQTAHKESRVSDGTITDDFAAKKKSKSLPMNNYSLIILKAEGSQGTLRDVDNNSGFGDEVYQDTRVRDSFPPSAYEFVTDSELAEQRALIRLAGKASLSSVNLGMMFAERKKTANLIQSSATRLYRVARGIKRADPIEIYAALGMDTRQTPNARDFERLRKTPLDKRLANHWLEYNFGWVPLLQEINGACELLAKHVVDNTIHGKIAASARVRTARALLRTGGYPFNGVHQQDVRTRYTLYYSLQNDARNALAETGITNPLTVAWDVLPFSFVVDWFVPVAQYLRKLDAFDGFEYVKCCKSRLWRGKTEKNFSWAFRQGAHTQQSSGRAVFEEVQYHRTGLGSIPSLIPPKFRNPLEDEDIWKPLTSLALLAQVFR